MSTRATLAEVTKDEEKFSRYQRVLSTLMFVVLALGLILGCIIGTAFGYLLSQF